MEAKTGVMQSKLRNTGLQKKTMIEEHILPYLPRVLLPTLPDAATL